MFAPTVLEIPPIEIAVTVIVSPSKSESLFNTPFTADTFNAVSSLVDLVSATATGASFIEFTVMFKVLTTVVVPSETVYVTSGTAPLKSSAGVNS